MGMYIACVIKPLLEAPRKSFRNYSFAFLGASMAREVPRALNTKLLKLPKTREPSSPGQGRPDGPSAVLKGPVGVAVSLLAGVWSPTLAPSTTELSAQDALPASEIQGCDGPSFVSP